MRRRISLTMFAMVVGALLFAGLATLGLTSLNSVHETQTELASDAKKLAQGVQKAVATGRHHESIAVLRQSLSVLKAPLAPPGRGRPGRVLERLTVRTTCCGPRPGDAATVAAGRAPASGLTVDQLDIGDLINGLPVTGHRGRLAYAAYLFSTPVTVANVANFVVVLTREAPNGVGDAGVWFAIAAAATLAVALIVADRLGHRLARPLQQTEAVTRRIATGDLEARVPVPAGVGHELVSLATSVNQMAASLARAQGTQRQFLMSVSHDLRTPLTSIRGFAEALYDGATTDVHYASGIIVSEAGRLERLVTDLLELAKLEAGAFSLHCRPLDLSEVVSDTAQAFAPAASALGLAVQIRTAPPAEVRCDADRDRLGQVVANLVENALKFATSEVAVSTGVSAGPALGGGGGRRAGHPRAGPAPGLRTPLPVPLDRGPQARVRPRPGHRRRARGGHGRPGRGAVAHRPPRRHPGRGDAQARRSRGGGRQRQHRRHPPARGRPGRLSVALPSAGAQALAGTSVPGPRRRNAGATGPPLRRRWAGQRGLVGPFHHEAGVGDHGQVGGPGRTLGGEVIAQENGIGDVQAQAAAGCAGAFPGPRRCALRRRGRQNGTWPAPAGIVAGLSSRCPARGVPSKGIRKLTGTESGRSSCKLKATSTSSSSDSPMPTITPEHGESPAPAAWRTVPTLSSKECVLHMLP